MAELGDRIKYLREKKGLTQKELCKKAELTIVQLSRYETNVRKPDPDALKKIADILETSIDYLVGRTKEITPSHFNLDDNQNINVAYFGGAKEELTEEEAQRLKEELEMFRLLKEKKLREKNNK